MYIHKTEINANIFFHIRPNNAVISLPPAAAAADGLLDFIVWWCNSYFVNEARESAIRTGVRRPRRSPT